jgi:hypothetical protein
MFDRYRSRTIIVGLAHTTENTSIPPTGRYFRVAFALKPEMDGELTRWDLKRPTYCAEPDNTNLDLTPIVFAP